MRRILFPVGVVLVIGGAVAAYVFVPFGSLDILDKAHAAVAAIQTQPGDPDGFLDRMKVREFDLASQKRQTDGATALNHPPAGVMTRLVQLPAGAPNGAVLARQICTYLEKDGFNQQMESQFPLAARTDSHSFKLQSVTTPNGVNAVQFSFEYTGFIRQGEPRKIADYGESLVRKEVNLRCWMAAGFDAHPAHVPDVSPTAVITDLPNEPDTAAAQAKLFTTTPPALTSTPAVPMPAVQAPPAVSPAPAPAIVNRPVVATPPQPANSAPAGSDLIIKKQPTLPSGGVVLNGMDFQTAEPVKTPDMDKLLSQGQPNGAAKNGSPLDQPAAERIHVQQEQEHPQ